MLKERFILSDELKERLLQDILKTGFPLEMEISQKLRNNGWNVRNGSYYIDKDEDKGREIDVISTIHMIKDLYKEVCLEVVFSLIIEIKKTEGKPWVFFTSEVNDGAEKIIPKKFALSGFSKSVHEVGRLLRKNTQKINKRIGRNFYQGFTSSGGRDDIYKALSGVIKATQHSLENCAASNDESGDRLFNFFEPVVVIQGKLFETYITQNGEHALEEVNSVQTQFNYLSSNYPSRARSQRIVHVITSDYLDTFINERKESLGAFFDDLITNQIY
jgi:hypothetical protein